MGCVIPTSLSVCASECEAFCSRIDVCFEGGWLRIGLCGLSCFLLVVVGFMPCHTRVVFWLFFSASLKFYEHEKMTEAWCWVFHTVSSFLDVWTHFCVLMWCCLARLRLSCVEYLSLCWKLHFGMLMCVCYLRVRAACLRHGVRSFADVWCRPEESLWPNSCVVCCVLCVSLDFSSVLCLFRVCTDFQNIWFPCLVLVWMISHLIPQGCACYRVKLKSMRRTLWWSGKSWHLCWRSWSFIFRFPS